MFYHFFLNDRYIDDGITAIIFDMYQHATEIREVILDKDDLNDEMYVGRVLTVEDTASLVRAFDAKSESDFEDKMWNRADNDTLTMEYLQRVCENASLKYKLAGHKLRYAIQQDQKAERRENESKWSEARQWCREARRCLRHDSNWEPRDLDRAESLAAKASRVDYPRAYGLLAECNYIRLRYAEAVKWAQEAVKQDDPTGMYILAVLYLKGADVDGMTDNVNEPDYENGAQWCMKAALKGEPRAANSINQLIHEGHLNPKTDEAMRVLAAIARRNKIRNK